MTPTIIPYAGQPLPPGTIVLMESWQSIGICSWPYVVLRETAKTVYLQDPRYSIDKLSRAKTRVRYVCATLEAAEYLAKVDYDFRQSEMAIEEIRLREREQRRADVIDAAIRATAVSAPE